MAFVDIRFDLRPLCHSAGYMQAKLGKDKDKFYSTALGSARDKAFAGFLPAQSHADMYPEYPANCGISHETCEMHDQALC